MTNKGSKRVANTYTPNSGEQRRLLGIFEEKTLVGEVESAQKLSQQEHWRVCSHQRNDAHFGPLKVTRKILTTKQPLSQKRVKGVTRSDKEVGPLHFCELNGYFISGLMCLLSKSKILGGSRHVLIIPN